MATSFTAAQALAFRVRAQQLDRTKGSLADTAVLDAGVQDSGTDGGRWALAIRGVEVDDPAQDLVLAWTLRGAPHFYRRSQAPAVAAAVAPFSPADAAKRIFDAAKPLRAAGIDALTALDTVAEAMRAIVTRPTAKGEVSTRLTSTLDKPFLRECRPCQAIHIHEQPFRLAALRAGLELEPGTSPPVLRRIPRFRAAIRVPASLDVVRTYLRLLGPATPKHVAEYLDSPLAEVKAHWPDDAVEVELDGERRWALADDVATLGGPAPRVTRLLAPFDLFLQARDRATIVPDQARAKALWPVLGRPGAVLVDAELAGLWRPRQSGGRLSVQVEPWRALPPATRRAVTEQAERLAAFRGVTLAGVDFAR